MENTTNTISSTPAAESMSNVSASSAMQELPKQKSYKGINILLLILSLVITAGSVYVWMNQPEKESNTSSAETQEEETVRDASTKNVANDLKIQFQETTLNARVVEESSVNLTIDGDISKIESLELYLTFDSEVLEITKFEKGARLGSFEDMQVSNDTGTILLKGSNPNITVSSNILGKLYFKPLSAGETFLQVLEDDLDAEFFATVKFEGDETVYSLGTAEVGIKVE